MRPGRTPIGAIHAESIVALAAALLASGCTHRAKARFHDTRPPEVLVEVLPRSAEVWLDDRAIGPGSRAVLAPGEDDSHVLVVRAPGFRQEERLLPAGGLEGARVGAVLRPDGFAAAELDLDEPDGLALAAAFLAANGDAADAVDYAERALALDGGSAVAHRALGDAQARLGRHEAAAASWSAYLRLAPGAPDAAAVARRIEEVREGLTLPPGR
jgi:tetratricopeptide (TPR) repeat protein